MKKLHTLIQFQTYLDTEYSWRLKEIADVKLLVRQASSLQQRTAIRAGVPLLYAHWEGFIKNASRAYLNHVNCQCLSYRQLSSCLIVFGVKRLLADLIGSQKPRATIAAVDFFFDDLDKSANLRLKHAVDTESNLKSQVFDNIAVSLGINPSPYKSRYNLIDESLLRQRNEIAHGEYVNLSSDAFRTLSDEVLELMRRYKTDLENSAAQKAYLRVGGQASYAASGSRSGGDARVG